MNDSNLLQTLGQVSSDEAGQIFRDHLRGFVREMISDVMASEVTELCGPKHQPSSSQYVRSGSSSGRVLVDGERESVVRPRVRKYGEDGNSAVSHNIWDFWARVPVGRHGGRGTAATQSESCKRRPLTKV